MCLEGLRQPFTSTPILSNAPTALVKCFVTGMTTNLKEIANRKKWLSIALISYPTSLCDETSNGILRDTKSHCTAKIYRCNAKTQSQEGHLTSVDYIGSVARPSMFG